jgi:hypothetical protein
VKVVVIRSGGFAGVERRGEGDTSSDPVLRTLVAQVDLNAVPARTTPVPDQFVYEITIGDITADVDESRLTPPLRALVHHVLG